MNKVFLTILLSFTVIWGSAQKTNNYWLYNYDKKIINPSFAGLADQNSFALFNNILWAGYKIENFPLDIMLSYETQLSEINSGFALIATNSRIGPSVDTEINIFYNYQLKLNDAKQLIFGLGPKYIKRSSVDFSNWDVLIPDDDIINFGPELYNNTSRLDLDAGISFKSKNLQVGVSYNNIFNAQLDDENSFSIRRQFLNGYFVDKFQINEWVSMAPSILFQTNFDSFYTDLNLNSRLFEILNIGSTYRIGSFGKELLFNIGISLKEKVHFHLHTLSTQGIQNDNMMFQSAVIFNF